MIFKDTTVVISGATRGIGKAIALKLAAAGANIVIAAKSVTENEKLGGTIYSAAEEVEAAGGRALPVACDVRMEDQVKNVMEQAVAKFGGIDILVNNASAISLTDTASTPVKRYDLMQEINVRGSFLMVQAALPHLKKSANAHILTLSPPVNLNPKWLGPHIAYTISKYNMSLLTLGWAAEFKDIPIAANALWPKTTIDTAAVRNLLGGQALASKSRNPQIVADAAFYILQKSAGECTGNCFTDEQVLEAAGIANFDSYAVTPGEKLYTDLFLDN
ncbi:SDR family oxidoreductase [Niabella drilacis]|uniref:Citronellol/citronellal dehydrogenase n=1 Tax=Niabella drilacis (strain DSM 25811 / CCM 8410 / CCUG 62505 / LMG 26954 / E90) TaxID=1285928 RepID=A0A1G7AF16_NIADE|nr:NAD(P)-dependent oxidoreductase [Niabella drilacis]SDE12466.1 citronellol/citronellal dehydrogenase [Niabella drilacis]